MTHCKNNHEQNEINQFTDKKGHKKCRICLRERAKGYRQTYKKLADKINKTRMENLKKLREF